MIIKRRRIKHVKTFEERLAEEALRLKEAAKSQPFGLAREGLLRRAREAEIAAHMSDWLRSPGLRPPQ